MARKPRIHLPGGVYHVMLRGNNGRKIFIDDKDYFEFESLVEEGVNRFKHRIHAYCWMTNHVHLAIQVNEIPLSKIIQNLAFRFTRYFNKEHHRKGHLFQGRYKAILVESNAYIQELIRYIHLNPVRANIVNQPEKYRWSGHNSYMGSDKKPWLTTHWLLSTFAKSKEGSLLHYSSFIRNGIGEGFRKDFYTNNSKQAALADDEFNVKEISNKVSMPKEITLKAFISCILDHIDLTAEELKSKSRNHKVSQSRSMIGYIWKNQQRATVKEYAEWLGRDITTVSKNIRNLEIKMHTNQELRELVEEMASKIQ